MKLRKAILVSVILWAALAAYYLPALLAHKGGITFGLIQDISAIYGFYPWDVFSLREIRSGYFPLWNPYNALGEPHLANMQTAIFYPLTWLKFIFGMNLRALDFILLLRLYLAGIFAYLFCRRNKLDFTPSVVAALSFMLTGYFTRHIYMSHLNVEILIPAIMLVFGELARKPNIAWFSLSALAVWLSIVGGFPEATLYALTMGAAYFLVIAPFRRWILLIAVGSVGFICAAAQTLPFIEYMSHAWFYHPPGIGAASFDVKYFFSLWAPWFFGENDVSPLVPFLSPYLGLAPIALAVASLKKGLEKYRWFFPTFALICFSVIYGILPIAYLTSLPYFNISFNYKYAAPCLAFCVAYMAGAGAQELTEGKGRGKLIAAVPALTLILFAALLLDSHKYFAPYYRIGATTTFIQPLVTGVILIICVIFIKTKYKSVTPLLLIIISAWLPVRGNKPKYDDTIDKTLNSPEYKYLQAHAAEGRFTAADHIIFPNLNLLGGLYDFRYYNPMYSKQYADNIKMLNKIEDIEDEDALGEHFKNHAMLMIEQESAVSTLLLNWWIGEGPPGTIDLIHEFIVEGDWRTRNQGMIGREKYIMNGFESPILFSHAPSEVNLIVYVPNNQTALRLKPTLDQKAVNCSDGANFSVIADDGAELQTIFSVFIKPENIGIEYTIPISQFAVDDIKLHFITTPGPDNNINCDWSGWASVSLGNMEPEKWKRLSNISDRLWELTEGETIPAVYEDKCDDMTSKIKLLNNQRIEVDHFGCKMKVPILCLFGTYPGWKGIIKNNEIKKDIDIYVADTKTGPKDIEILYKPSSFRVGLWTTLTSAIVFLFFALFRKRKSL